jgi:glutathione S-transferase
MYLLHYAPDNASLIVRLALEEAGLPYRTRLVDRAARGQEAPAFRALNPIGRIPVLETPDGPLAETGAILLWLADRHGGLGPGPGTAGRGPFLTWLFFASNTLHADLLLQFYPDRYTPPGAAADVAALTRARLAGSFALFDALAAAGRPWFAAGNPTVLDLYVVTAMRWAALYTAGAPRWFRAGDHPALAALARRLEARPAARRAALAEGLGRFIFYSPEPPEPPEGSPT